MKLDNKAFDVISTRRAEGKSMSTITKELRNYGYTTVSGYRLTPQYLYNALSKKKATKETAPATAVVTTLIPNTTYTDVTTFVRSVVVHPTWSAEKKVRVIEAAL